MKKSVVDLRLAKEDAEAANRSKQEQLAELELLYRMAPVGLGLMDKDCRAIRLNERMAMIAGVPGAPTKLDVP